MSSSITSSHAHHRGANTSSSASSSAKTPVTLDLHGCTKPQAIQKLTTFFDQIRSNHYNNNSNKKTSYPVTVITGSGKHSTHGPVLRQAVQHLLEKRQMTFHLNHHGGKGSFHVDALSGIDLMDRALMRQTSSKILVVNRNVDEEDDEGHVRLFQRCINRNMEYSRQRRQDSAITATVIDDDDNNNHHYHHHHDHANDDILPTPSEVARDDDLIQQVKMISQTEAMQMKSLEIKEKNEVQKAIHESESVHVQMQMQMQDDLELTKVLFLSREQHKQKIQECQDQEQKMLTNMLEMSLQEEKEREERERLELEKVLALSEKESLVVEGQGQGQDKDEEDLVLMQVLECSKRQEGRHMNFEEQMKLALEESLLLSL